MKLLKILSVILILSLYSFNSYADECSDIKMDSSVNIVKKLKCKVQGGTQQSEITTTENSTQEKKNGILSKIWKKPEWMKKKN